MSTAGNRGAGFPQDQGRAEQGSVRGTADRLAGAVKDKAQDVASTAGNLASQARDRAQDLASRVGETAQETWESTRQGAQQVASRVASQAGDALDNVSDLIRRYPVASLCCAFAIGFVFAKGMEGMMSGNRSSS